MTALCTRAALAALFEAGDIPSAGDFSRLLDSVLLPVDDDASRLSVDPVTAALWAGFFDDLPADTAGRLTLVGLLNQLITTFFGFAAAGYRFRGRWLSGGAQYAVGECVMRAGQLYAVKSAHISSTWATDFAEGRFEPVIRFISTPLAASSFLRRSDDNDRWETRTAAEIVEEGGDYLLRAGGTMLGPLELAGDAYGPMQPVTLRYAQAQQAYLQAQLSRVAYRFFLATGCGA